MQDTPYDITECPNCHHKTAEVLDNENDNYYVSCPCCGRTTMNSFETIEEAIYNFKNDSSVEYQ